MNILIEKTRISGFRGLENIEVELEQTTILTGMNNSGKTSFIKALQLAFGQRQFITQDDFYIKNNVSSKQIIVDLLIIPVDKHFQRIEDFSEDWEILFTTDRIKTDGVNSFIPLRTIITFDTIKNTYKSKQYSMQKWPLYFKEGTYWYDSDNGNKTSFNFDELPFFYMDAQRDILEDTKLRSSYLGKMLSKFEYSADEIIEIETKIKELNDKTVSSSEILSNLKNTLKELDLAMGSNTDGIDITPFTKKIRDLSKGLTIYYSDNNDSFSMEYHGMGTRSWSSLLTLKSYILLLSNNAEAESNIFFPIIAIEEPEAHLHPNAQKKLYSQINAIKGQKIISTHSPYIAATAELNEIRNFYKNDIVTCGKIMMDKLKSEDIRKIRRQVINTKGEIFFSKAIIFFEGETEEQALPIFSERYFGLSPVEMGLDFVGVGGYNNYLPFLRFADNLNIPWFILSDAEADVIPCIGKQIIKSETVMCEEDVVVFLDCGNDFERQLIDDGFIDEIKKSIASFDEYKNEQHRKAKENSRLKEIADYTNDELYTIITNGKTKYAPVIAEQIIASSKPLPPKLVDLFEKIAALLHIVEVN